MASHGTAATLHSSIRRGDDCFSSQATGRNRQRRSPLAIFVPLVAAASLAVMAPLYRHGFATLSRNSARKLTIPPSSRSLSFHASGGCIPLCSGGSLRLDANDGPASRRLRFLSMMASATETGHDYKKMTVSELKATLKDRKLDLSGKKADLVARLVESDSTSPEPEAVEEPPAETAEAQAPEAESKGSDEKKDEKPVTNITGPVVGVSLKCVQQGKPDQIVDDEGRTRYLCLDGRYRRGDPDVFECHQDNFADWLSEWVVAARTGKLEGLPQKTFLPDDLSLVSNPQGTENSAGKEIKSEDILDKKAPGPDGTPVWELKDKARKNKASEPVPIGR